VDSLWITPPLRAAAGAAATAVSHIPQSLKKNFSLIALMHLHHCITSTTDAPAPLHHPPPKKNFSQITHHTKKTIDTHPRTHRQSLIEKKFF
jgi:hypothetical protein